MLHTDLLRLINTGDAWAFVGSGASIEAGGPTWESLLSDLEGSFSDAEMTQFLAHPASGKEASLPLRLSAAEAVVGRERLETGVRSSLSSMSRPGALHDVLADLPFAGYITTNYDDLLEKALNARDPGWGSVGNVGDEVRKASGTAARVVWHLHGSISLPDERSRLTLTHEDYDELYDEGSRVLRQLRGLLANRRVVIVGFGFRDSDVLDLLRRVGRLTDPTRPIHALVETASPFKHDNDRRVFLTTHRVDVHPYPNRDGTHRELLNILRVYQGLSLRRSLRYGRSRQAVPTYDPETTGLLLYNEMVLDRRIEFPDELRLPLIRARVLTSCRQPKSLQNLQIELQDLTGTLMNRLGTPAAASQIRATVTRATESLVADQLLTELKDGTLILSDSGSEALAERTAESDRLGDQFAASLRTRVAALAEALGVDPEGPLQVVQNFFARAVARRALGVAMAFATGNTPGQQDYHALALLQSVADILDTAADEREALAVVECIQQVFQRPTDAESQYLSTAVQARFAFHLLSIDDDTLRLRLREMSECLFIIDSSTLIPWLAVGSVGHEAATSLISRLLAAGANVATTPLLQMELAEHARWAHSRIESAGGIQTTAVLEAATGRAGQRSNAFIEGLLNTVANEVGVGGFREYIRSCLGEEPSQPVSNEDVERALTRHGIGVLDLAPLTAGDAQLSAEVDQRFQEVKDARSKGGTLTHDRQARAEAEVLVIIEEIRSECSKHESLAGGNAYFISQSSFLDHVAHSGARITLRPEAALAWLATLRPLSTSETGPLMSELLSELRERHMNLVDPRTLTMAFSPLIEASRAKLEAELPRYRTLIASTYGGDGPSSAPIADLDAPIVLDSVMQARVNQLEHELAEERERSRDLEQRAALTDDERSELERSRQKEQRRSRYERAKARRRQSKQGRRK